MLRAMDYLYYFSERARISSSYNFIDCEINNILNDCQQNKNDAYYQKVQKMLDQVEPEKLIDKIYMKSILAFYGEKSKNKKQYNINCDSLVAQYKDVYEIYELAAFLRMYEQNPKAAVKYMEDGLKAFPGYPRAELFYGLYKITSDTDAETGETMVNNALKANTASLYNLAGIFYENRTRDDISARKYFTQALKIDGNNPITNLRLGYMEAYVSKRKESAVSYFDKACLNSPYSLYDDKIHLQFMFNNGQYFKAKDFVEKIMKTQKTGKDIKLIYIDIMEDGLRKHKVALAYIDSVLVEDSTNYRALEKFALIQRFYQSPENYEQRIKTGLDNYPNESVFHLEQGKIYLYQKQDLEKARVEFETAITLSKESSSDFLREDAYNYFELGNYYASDKIQKYSKAADNYEKAATIEFMDPRFSNILGVIYMTKLKKYDKARDAFNKAIKNDAKNPESYLNLIDLTKNYEKNPEEANKLIDVAIVKFPQDPRFPALKN